jgi:hypothetical protein
MAMEGHNVALKLCIDRVFPKIRKGHVLLKPIEIRKRDDGTNEPVGEAVLRAIGERSISLEEGQLLMNIAEAQVRIDSGSALKDQRELTMDQTKKEIEVESTRPKSGVMIVAMAGSDDEWEKFAAKQNKELKERVRE